MWLAPSASAEAQTRLYNTADIQAGYRLYSSQCALCHGNNGDGVAGVNLPRQQFRRASTDDDIRNTVSTGVAAAGMPSFRFQPAELNGLVAYIRSGFDASGAPFKVGNAARGQAIYNDKGDACATTATASRATVFAPAPDLTDIGAIHASRPRFKRSLLTPTAAMLPINRPVRIVMRDGRAIRGRRLNEDTFTVQLIDENERLVSLEKSEIRQSSSRDLVSANAPSFAGKLTDEEIADLLAYLRFIKGTLMRISLQPMFAIPLLALLTDCPDLQRQVWRAGASQRTTDRAGRD